MKVIQHEWDRQSWSWTPYFSYMRPDEGDYPSDFWSILVGWGRWVYYLAWR